MRDLLNHLFLVVINFRALADRTPADFDSVPDRIKGDRRGRAAKE